jgi:multiple antibiotic resistance protein
METVHCNEHLKFFLALLAIVNPVGILPIFINMTASQDRVARNRNGTLAAVSMGIILLVVLVSGEALLRCFSISVDSFRVGGGILVLLMAISMLNARVSNVRQTREEELDSAERDSVAVVPLGCVRTGLPIDFCAYSCYQFAPETCSSVGLRVFPQSGRRR